MRHVEQSMLPFLLAATVAVVGLASCKQVVTTTTTTTFADTGEADADDVFYY